MSDSAATLYQQERRRVFSTLVRLLGSFDAADDAMHDAFIAAAEHWPQQGVPNRRAARADAAGELVPLEE